ncbi:5-bromo-4-chloroindolyl phosphate hydrolysis family protein [Aerococcus sp. UMB1112A]|uniref:5-bromo-4-chloroindolyl phosphate hydrolysis family protein n=1 Tax=Aerococcus sp. UMB1112A TaxID=3050609 RepID=UPI00254B0CC8|nr:5-bromo-4-chloroindolyl phosphate hydrolysis family protein [Aerococcus sp. UMB1112A]MDK8502146.1 5-bromo-4-chloroindolyl phosphate hydrolysis family protein [Aerococcus sp. UMB1112A]
MKKICKRTWDQVLYSPFNVLLILAAWWLDLKFWPTLATILLVNFAICYYLKKRHSAPHLSRKNYQHYKEHGLSDQDIQYFRQEMATSLEQIERILALLAQTGRKSHGQVKAQEIKAYFHAIQQDPHLLADSADFRYQLLPSLEKELRHYQLLTTAREDASELAASRKELDRLGKEIQASYKDFLALTI